LWSPGSSRWWSRHFLNHDQHPATRRHCPLPRFFYRGGAEQKIRQYLVDNNYVETVIALAPNLFFGITIAVSILVLSKHKIDKPRAEIDAIVAQIEGDAT